MIIIAKKTFYKLFQVNQVLKSTAVLVKSPKLEA